MPTHITTVKRKAATVTGNKINVEIPITIHVNQEKEIIILNYPGFNGDINGYNNKYLTLAKSLQEKVGAVIQMGNQYNDELDYTESVQDDVRAVIEYAIEHASEICKSENPQIYLMGFSAGASAIAAVCHEYPEVKKILLMAPSGDAGQESVEKGLSEFSGEVFIVIGANDEVVGVEAGKIFANLVKKTSAQLTVVPNCDHQFRGTENGMIMSNAPVWAFIGGINFPTPEGGVKLY